MESVVALRKSRGSGGCEYHNIARKRSRGTEEEEIQARWVERNCINGDSRDKETSRGHIKFLELVGGVPKDTGALDGVGSGEGDFREVEEPVKIFERNVAAYHTSPIHEKLGGDLDIGSDLGRGLEARPCRNYTPLSGLASNGVERVAETIFAVKLDPKENVGGDVNGQKKSYAERINKNVNLGFSDARDPIEEDKDESDVKVLLVRRLVRLHRIDVLLFQESHLLYCSIAQVASVAFIHVVAFG
ncbi:hypothetical protein V6N11_072958 [Hibiscus sabdariffa]|uniref:Uncharacterized protein n=1 Tax=Hibiscus sabdariffa TaxID=183260 RepID=A0ABR2NX50_9ROSI